jgi:hypothetical protein
MNRSRAGGNAKARGSSTSRARKKPVTANASASSAGEGGADFSSRRKAGRRSSFSRHGAPASRDTARPDYGDT